MKITVCLPPNDPFPKKRLFGITFDITHTPETHEVSEEVATILRAKRLVIDPEKAAPRRVRVEKDKEEHHG